MKRKAVAVTGGIGSGKSEVLSILRNCGYQTVSCDELAKTVASFPEVIDKVRRLLGAEFILQGQLNRKAIREKIFSDKELLALYNGIFFGEIKRLLLEKLHDMQGIVFVEIPVFDAFDFDWDAVWLVECDDETRIGRAAKRDGITFENAANISRSQNYSAEHSYKIVNNGSLSDLEQTVNEALQNL